MRRLPLKSYVINTSKDIREEGTIRASTCSRKENRGLEREIRRERIEITVIIKSHFRTDALHIVVCKLQEKQKLQFSRNHNRFGGPSSANAHKILFLRNTQ